VYVRPARNDDGGKCIALEAWSYAIAKGSKSPEAAWALMRFLTVDKDGGGWFMNQQTRPSPVKEFNQNPELRQRNPYWDVLVRSLDRSAPPGTFLPVHGELVTVINENVTRLEQGQYSVRDTAAAMRQDGQRILDGFWAAKRK
jgi:ABC-type glycerol-3-phosphate transport system substrate-binding protein